MLKNKESWNALQVIRKIVFYGMGVFDSIILSNPMSKIPMMLYVAGLRPHETGVVV